MQHHLMLSLDDHRSPTKSLMVRIYPETLVAESRTLLSQEPCDLMRWECLRRLELRCRVLKERHRCAELLADAISTAQPMARLDLLQRCYQIEMASHV